MNAPLLPMKGASFAIGQIVSTGMKIAYEEYSRRENIKVRAEESKLDYSRTRSLASLNSELRTAEDRDRVANQLRMQKDLALSNARLEAYPFAAGPGLLQDSLSLLAGRDPVVILVPSRGDGSSQWKGILNRVATDLSRYTASGGIRGVRVADRSFDWPNSDLYHGDLAGVPAILVFAASDGARLNVEIGTCHLGSDVQPATAPIALMQIRYPSEELWSSELVDAVNDTSSSGEHFRLPNPDDPARLDELNRELAARAVSLCTVAVMDAYHLVHTPQYDEKIDQARLEAAVASDDFEPGLGIEISSILDPGYHLLHQVVRYARREQFKQAEDVLERALVIIATGRPDVAYDEAKPAEAVQQLDERGRAKLQDAVRALADGRNGELPRAVGAALDQYPVLVAPDNPTSTDLDAPLRYDPQRRLFDR